MGLCAQNREVECALVVLGIRRGRRIAVGNLGDIEPAILFIQVAFGHCFLSLHTPVYKRGYSSRRT
jgi:hypothetical protein